MTDGLGLLCMAMGTPASLDEIDAFYARIRGRPPAPELVRDLRARYAAIGGRSPLLEITRAQAEGVASRVGLRAYLGMKYSSPFISEAVRAMRDDGVRRAVALPLAPHAAQVTSSDYATMARRAIAASGGGIELKLVRPWHLHPTFLAALAARLVAALEEFPRDERDAIPVLFTAHSLPLRVVERGDPYPHAVRATARALADRCALREWHVAWQSAGRTGEPWLGPDVSEVLPAVARTGVAGVVVAPIGFVSDHLEVLYDVDVQHRGIAASLGLRLVRTASLNDEPLFLDALAEVVRVHLEERGAA